MGHRVFKISEIRDLLAPVFASYPVNKAILFGSYAKGCATEYSDIDIYVDTQLKGLEFFFGLLEDVNDALNIPVDLVERRTLYANGSMVQEIEKRECVYMKVSMHDYKVVQTMLRHCYKLQKTVLSMGSYEKFISNDAADASVTRLSQVGELAKVQLSDSVKNAIKGIPWKQIYGLRNRTGKVVTSRMPLPVPCASGALKCISGAMCLITLDARILLR